jgi:hypothetical protein
MVSLLSRPEKVINGYTSRWNAGGGDLPLIYKLESDTFPTNSVDATDTVTSVTNSNGYAQLNLSGTYETYTVGQYLTVATTNYTGVFRIRAITSSTQIVIDTTFIVTDTGTIQLYYIGYYIEVNVYAGIEASHPLSTGISLIGTLKSVPNSANIAVIDVREYVQALLYNRFTQTNGNDVNLWTDFYITYREVYLDAGVQVFGALSTDIANICHASNSVLQLGNTFGGNMFAYVCDADKVAGKWLTMFSRLKWVDFRYMDTSLLVNEDTFFIEVIEYDLDNVAINTQQLDYVDGYGIYRVVFSELYLLPTTEYFTLQAKTTYATISELLTVDYSIECLEFITPEAPTNLVMSGGEAQIVWNWIDNSDNETGFVLYARLDGDPNFSIIATLPANTTTYTQTGLSGGQIWFGFVRATNNGNLSAPSNIATAEVLSVSFKHIVDTLIAGTSGVGNYTMPLSTNPIDLNLDIYIDDVFLRKVTDAGGRTITLAEFGGTSGLKTIKLVGAMERWRFAGGGDKDKLTDITQWGQFNTDISFSFQGCINLTNISATDAPVNAITNPSNDGLNFMFFNASNFNSTNLLTWDFSNVVEMRGLIGGTAFNRDIAASISTPKCTSFFQFAEGASAFNQSLGGFDVQTRLGRTTIDMQRMMLSCGMNTANYDATLNGWAAQTSIGSGICQNVNASGQVGRTYSAAGLVGRNTLTNDNGWTISNDTLV